MINLLGVELKSMFNKTLSKFVLVLSMVFGIFLAIANEVNNQLSCLGIFEYGLVLLIFLPAIVGFYISKDYSQNTIKNKIIAGHKRINIYLSKFFTVTMYMLLCMTLFCISLIISNCILIGTCGFNKDAIVLGLILMFLCTISIASITTLISMITKNEIGALAPLLVTFLMLIFCMLGMEMFSNNIMNVITDILPVGQLMTLNILEVPERFTLKVIYSVITVFLTTLLGYLLFRKADLK